MRQAGVNLGDVMEAYARDAEADAFQRGIVLDYSEASLEQVDTILEAVARAVESAPRSATEDVLWALSKKYGGYIGQVVIKHLGGQWAMEDLPDGKNARVTLICCEIRGYPLEKIHKRLTGDQFSGVAGYCRALRTIVEARQSK